uniref:Uncharacterized protein n=1 Tax=Helianthus annuus TaxID=4232 RepID=A0A251UIA3_HELAN
MASGDERETRRRERNVERERWWRVAARDGVVWRQSELQNQRVLSGSGFKGSDLCSTQFDSVKFSATQFNSVLFDSTQFNSI